MQDQAAQQVAKALKEANNVMVTVKNSPSVDELTAAVALTLMLNHLNKHATTVFSGVVPSTIEFLQPEMAIESNTDSLRDFIISLDKSKADKLRYKVEDNVVRIFITPYRTSISEQDLEFSQGDFNVDVVVALGVIGREDFDQAVTSHGRILHDATVIGVTNQDQVSQIGAINWHDSQASGVSEMIASITEELGENVLDGQIATSLMTGMVAETDRFKNKKTTPRVLALSSKLMSAGANQQLIAEKLEETPPVDPIVDSLDESVNPDGMLDIEHVDDLENEVQEIHIDDHGNLDIPRDGPEDLVIKAEATGNVEAPASVSDSAPSEAPLHEYIAEPAKTAAPDKSEADEAAPIGLFSNQSVQNERQNASDDTTLNEKILEHEHKVINPLEHSSDSTSAPQFGLQESSAQTVREAITPTVDPEDEIISKPVIDTRSLLDLEEAVVHPSEEKITSSPKLDDYTGSVREPEPAKIEEIKTEEEKVADLLSSQVIAPEKVVEAPKPKNEKEEEPAPPEVVTPSSAPAVPPPIMPQSPSLPQFFEADGSKSDNSLLNPTGK